MRVSTAILGPQVAGTMFTKPASKSPWTNGCSKFASTMFLCKKNLYLGVSKNNGIPKWMENPIKMDDLGVPLFLETPILGKHT